MPGLKNGMANRREAGESILTFLSRLFEQATLERCSKESARQLLGILAPKGPGLYRLLLGSAAGAVPPSRLTYISEAMVNILKVLPPFLPVNLVVCCFCHSYLCSKGVVMRLVRMHLFPGATALETRTLPSPPSFPPAVMEG